MKRGDTNQTEETNRESSSDENSEDEDATEPKKTFSDPKPTEKNDSAFESGANETAETSGTLMVSEQPKEPARLSKFRKVCIFSNTYFKMYVSKNSTNRSLSFLNF